MTKPVAPDALCACGHTGFHHAFGACDVSRGGVRVDNCERFTPTECPECGCSLDQPHNEHVGLDGPDEAPPCTCVASCHVESHD